MQRRHLFELHELPWCPDVLRHGLTDFLEAAIERNDVFPYLLPLIPLVVLIDGAISCWRTYTVEELRAMAIGVDYQWRRGTVQGPRWPLPITYLVGVPPP